MILYSSSNGWGIKVYWQVIYDEISKTKERLDSW